MITTEGARSRTIFRAIRSVQEELEAVDWYNRRAEQTSDRPLKKILEHIRDADIEHALMTLEWLRRPIKKFDENMKTYLFTEGGILENEEEVT